RPPGTYTLSLHDALPILLDADQDGVPDSLDACPNTALGTAVDASGCPLPSTPPPPLPPPPTTSGGGCVNSGSAGGTASIDGQVRSEEHTSELLSRFDLVC